MSNANIVIVDVGSASFGLRPSAMFSTVPRERTFKSDKQHLWSDLFRRIGCIPFPSDDHIG